MGMIINLFAGGLIGWLAGMVMNSSHGIIMNIIIGLVGSGVGSWFFGGILKIGDAKNAGEFSKSGLVFGVLGAIVLIAVLRFFGLGS